MNDKPDYKKYSKKQLREVAENIDRNRYPDRYEEVCELLGDRNHEKKRERSIFECVIMGIGILAIAIYQLFTGSTVGRNGGFSIQEEPLFFWLATVSFVGIGIYNFFEAYKKYSNSKNV